MSDVEVSDDNGNVVIEMDGEFDVQNAHEPYELIARAFATQDVRSVVVDLGAVRFIDSRGLGGLIQAKQEADAHGVPFRLRRVHERVRSVLAMTGLDHEFDVEPI